MCNLKKKKYRLSYLQTKNRDTVVENMWTPGRKWRWWDGCTGRQTLIMHTMSIMRLMRANCAVQGRPSVLCAM